MSTSDGKLRAYESNNSFVVIGKVHDLIEVYDALFDDLASKFNGRLAKTLAEQYKNETAIRTIRNAQNEGYQTLIQRIEKEYGEIGWRIDWANCTSMYFYSPNINNATMTESMIPPSTQNEEIVLIILFRQGYMGVGPDEEISQVRKYLDSALQRRGTTIQR